MSSYSNRKTTNRIALTLAVVAAMIGLFFLFAILATLLYRGFSSISLRMFLESTPPPGEDGGLLNAIFGSVAMTVIAVVVATPIGILAGTYLTEYSRGHWLGEAATTSCSRRHRSSSACSSIPCWSCHSATSRPGPALPPSG